MESVQFTITNSDNNDTFRKDDTCVYTINDSFDTQGIIYTTSSVNSIEMEVTAIGTHSVTYDYSKIGSGIYKSTVTVISPDGNSSQSYTFEINRVSDVVALSPVLESVQFTITNSDDNDTFRKDGSSVYTINDSFDTQGIIFTTQSVNSIEMEVTAIGTYSVTYNDNDNDITIGDTYKSTVTVTSPDGNSSQSYTFEIIRLSNTIPLSNTPSIPQIYDLEFNNAL